MTDYFLRLTREERAEILAAGEQQLGRSAQILEKDVWVCWTLQKLFAMPHAHPMAFKGGTSLSKAYGAISRFSEDIDITFDHASLAPGLDPFETGISRTQVKERPKRLGDAMDAHLESTLKPWFDAALIEELGGDALETTIAGNRRSRYLLLGYPSAIEDQVPYVAPHVMLEPGCRNAIAPASIFEIGADLAGLDLEEAVAFPAATVSVLSGARTFWEKATLIHAACVNPAKRLRAERIARHWYDLAVLATHDLGAAAMASPELLDDVIRVKSLVYPVPEVHYEDCGRGKLMLVPTGAHVDALEADYRGMIQARMFWEEPPSFEALIERLSKLEFDINERFG